MVAQYNSGVLTALSNNHTYSYTDKFSMIHEISIPQCLMKSESHLAIKLLNLLSSTVIICTFVFNTGGPQSIIMRGFGG